MPYRKEIFKEGEPITFFQKVLLDLKYSEIRPNIEEWRSF